jgi:cellulose synthase/poly-beta-1,6-N-acetylglucosamine synthase-like glycosyltransferase
MIIWLMCILLFLILYVYIIYPIFLFVLSKCFSKPLMEQSFEPSASIIIAAYNEEKHIKRRIENCLTLDYPREKMEIIVVSDCSTDNTDRIVKEFQDKVQFYRMDVRSGKTAAQNLAVEKAYGDILIFTDATTVCKKDVLRVIAMAFSNKEVGCVAGRLVYYKGNEPTTAASHGESLFCRYEYIIKNSESNISSLVGADGPLYAIRRELYQRLPEDSISDLVVPLKVVEKGYRVIYKPSAIAFEESTNNIQTEFNYRCRIVTRACRGIWETRALLNPIKYRFFTLQLISHKILRWFVPIYLFGLLAGCLYLAKDNSFFAMAFILQSAFYLSAVIGYLLEKKGIFNKILLIPYYFIIVNIACFLGLWKFIRGKKMSTWETIRK